MKKIAIITAFLLLVSLVSICYAATWQEFGREKHIIGFVDLASYQANGDNFMVTEKWVYRTPEIQREFGGVAYSLCFVEYTKAGEFKMHSCTYYDKQGKVLYSGADSGWHKADVKLWTAYKKLFNIR